jgi:hypothetical protein
MRTRVDAALWLGNQYQTYNTLGPMPMIRAALQYAGW